MATMTLTHQRGGLGCLVFILGIVAVGYLALQAVASEHAVIRHGDDAAMIRQCLDQNGPYQTWRNRDGNTFYQLCQLPDGRWGLRALVKRAATWFEKTAFVPKDGTWGEVLKYLGNIATRFTGTLQ